MPDRGSDQMLGNGPDGVGLQSPLVVGFGTKGQMFPAKASAAAKVSGGRSTVNDQLSLVATAGTASQGPHASAGK